MTGPTSAIHDLKRAEYPGAVVVIDVIRAFTTAAAAFDAGVTEIHCVEGVDEALALRDSIPGALLMGEEHGRPPEGFDFGNSPVDLLGLDLTGRVMVQRTSHGTKGLAWTTAPLVLAAAAVNASATARAAATMPPVALVCTSGRTTEDRVVAEHIQRLMTADPADDEHTRQQILATAEDHFYFWGGVREPDDAARFAADIAACAEIDRYDFAMVARRGSGPDGMAAGNTAPANIVTLTRYG